MTDVGPLALDSQGGPAPAVGSGSTGSSPLATLQSVYRASGRVRQAIRQRGGRVAAIAGWTVPLDLVRAAGFEPVVIAPGPRRALPSADELMEDSFTWGERAVFDQLLVGEWDDTELVILDRSWAGVFAYLSEARRLGATTDTLPPVHLFDDIQTPTANLDDHRRSQVDLLRRELERLSGSPVPAAAIAAAARTAARRRDAVARLCSLRRSGAVAGTDAMEAIGAGHFLEPAEHARLLDAWCLALPPARRSGPRLLLRASVPLADLALHQVIEAAGAIVVAEDDGWGARAFETDGLDLRAPTGPGASGAGIGVPGAEFLHRCGWLLSQAMDPQVDGVVMSVPLSDRTLGWDLPRLRAWLEERGLPLLVLDADVHENDKAVRQRCADFIGDVASAAPWERAS